MVRSVTSFDPRQVLVQSAAAPLAQPPTEQAASALAPSATSSLQAVLAALVSQLLNPLTSSAASDASSLASGGIASLSATANTTDLVSLIADAAIFGSTRGAGSNAFAALLGQLASAGAPGSDSAAMVLIGLQSQQDPAQGQARLLQQALAGARAVGSLINIQA